MRNLFRRHGPGMPGEGKSIPEDMWVRCAKCREMIYSREWEGNSKVCQKCGHHAPLTAKERVDLLLDEGSFEELDREMAAADPLGFAPPDKEPYRERLKVEQEKAGQRDAAIYGRGLLHDIPVVLAALDMTFLAGTMGAVVGEKVARACEVARDERRPLIVCSASGGARQHEGLFALMQMAKTAAAVRSLAQARVPYFSVLTDPTLAGVTASFAALGDCIIAEPGAVVGFAGPRIIEQATGEKLPPGADTAEFQLQHGMVDMVVPRRELKDAIARLARLYLDAAAAREATRTPVSHEALEVVAAAG